MHAAWAGREKGPHGARNAGSRSGTGTGIAHLAQLGTPLRASNRPTLPRSTLVQPRAHRQRKPRVAGHAP